MPLFINFKVKKMKTLIIELLEDVGNKGKGSIIEVKGNHFARLKNKGRAKLASEGAKINVLPSKELKEFQKKGVEKGRIISKNEEKELKQTGKIKGKKVKVIRND
jgi:hypothetical protein